jgi:acyl transferase domain-containing protein
MINSIKTQRPWHLLTLSAETEAALATQSAVLSTYFQKDMQMSLADVAYTLQVRCQESPYRKMFVGSDRLSIVRALEAAEMKAPVLRQQQDAPSVAFLFAGIGQQFVGMGQGLYQYEPFFRSIVDQGCEFLRPLLHTDLRDLLYPTSGSSEDGRLQLLQQTEMAQPLMFLVEYALARLLMHWGIVPHALLGYSLGEYVAACVAGVFSLEDALRLVARRASIIAQQPAGVMMAVLCSVQQARPFLQNEARVEIAVTNSPMQCVMAGPEEAIARVEARLEKAEIVSVRLPLGQAFHSHLLVGGQEALREEVKQIKRQAPTIPYISNVTGTWISQQEIEDDEYWGRHMCETAHFAEGVEELVNEGHQILIEIGPGNGLGSLVKQWELSRRAERKGKEPLMRLSTMRKAGEKREDHQILLEGIGKYWLAGGHMHWKAFWGEELACHLLQLNPSLSNEKIDQMVY